MTTRTFQYLITAQGVYHAVGLAVTQRSQARLYILQHLDEDATQSAQHHMTEAFLILGTNEQLGALQHLLHHHARGILDLHHAVELQCQMLCRADIQRHTAHIALVHRPHHLGYNRIAHPVGKSRQFFLGCGHHLRHHRNTSTLQQSSDGIWVEITTPLTLWRGVGCEAYNLSNLRHVNTKEFYLGRCGSRCLHNLAQRRGQRHLIAEIHMTFL